MIMANGKTGEAIVWTMGSTLTLVDAVSVSGGHHGSTAAIVGTAFRKISIYARAVIWMRIRSRATPRLGMRLYLVITCPFGMI